MPPPHPDESDNDSNTNGCKTGREDNSSFTEALKFASSLVYTAYLWKQE